MTFRTNSLMILVCFGVSILFLSLSPGHVFARSEADQINAQAAVAESLRGGWAAFAPFQSSATGSIEGAQGLDVDILAEVLDVAQMEAHLFKQTWLSQLQDLMAGRSDIALGAFLPAEGDDRFYYSLPYRWARVSLFVRAEEKERYSGKDAAAILSEKPQFRLGIIPGRLFQDTALNQAIAAATQSGRAVYAGSDEENLKNLVAGRIDGFVGDRLGVSAAALSAGLKFRAAEVPVPGTSSVHFLFSKRTVTPETLARINAAITTLEENGKLTKLLHNRIFFVVMGYALTSTAFFILGIIGTVTFAISGVLIAYREDFSLFGATVLAALPAVGGGALRDVLFDRYPLGVMSSPLDLCLVGATVLVSFGTVIVLQRSGTLGRRELPPAGKTKLLSIENIQEICDAAGLAAFTASGLAVAISVGADPLWIWGPISAMLTAAGGGILRDIVRQSGRVVSLKTSFYAEVPLLWGLAFSVFLLTRPAQLTPEEIGVALVVTVLGTFFSRLLIVFFGIRAIPFRWPAKS